MAPSAEIRVTAPSPEACHAVPSEAPATWPNPGSKPSSVVYVRVAPSGPSRTRLPDPTAQTAPSGASSRSWIEPSMPSESFGIRRERPPSQTASPSAWAA